MHPGPVEEPASPFPPAAPPGPACAKLRPGEDRLAWAGVAKGSAFGSRYFFGELFIHGNKMKPFNFKRKWQGLPVPRAETQYPQRSDKHQLSEDNALALYPQEATGRCVCGGGGGGICFRGNECVFHYPKRRVGEQLLSSFAWERYLPFPSTVFR